MQLVSFDSTLASASITFFIALFYTLLSVSDGCSSRSTPKPRPSGPTPRPNITFHTYACPPMHASWYCLNGATCFTIKIGEHLLHNCECSEGYMGPRCEFKNLDGTYLITRKQVLLETAGIVSGVAITILLVIIICMYLYIHHRKERHRHMVLVTICVDDQAPIKQWY